MRTGFWCGYVRESTKWEKLGTDEILIKLYGGVASSGFIWLSVHGEVAGCC
jgi:hypothetical protein